MAEKKKICFVTTVHGTLRAFVLEFAAYLYENGYDISLVCNPNDEFAAELPAEYHFFPIPMKRGISLDGFRVIKQLKKLFLRENFDIIQYATPNASLYASIAAKKADCPNRVYTQWGIRYMGFTGLRRTLFKFLEKRVCKASTYIEPESHGIYNFALSEKLYSVENAAVIWNGSACGVNLLRFDATQVPAWRSEIRARYHLSEAAVVFGFAGRLTRDKGCNELLTAFRAAQLPNAILLVMGAMDNEASLSPELLAWAKTAEQVKFTGRVQDLNKHYAALDAFVAPSYREGFGLVLVEAQAMGLPVIATDVPGQIDAFEPEKTGLAVKSHDAQTLQAALERLYADATLRKQLGEQARSYATQGFEQRELFKRIMQKRNTLIEREVHAEN